MVKKTNKAREIRGILIGVLSSILWESTILIIALMPSLLFIFTGFKMGQ